MRPVRKIPTEEERSQVIPLERMANAATIRQATIEPEPVGAIVLIPFQITGYTPDCDGSAMAQLEAIDQNGEPSGWKPDCISLHHDSHLVVTLEELRKLFDSA